MSKTEDRAALIAESHPMQFGEEWIERNGDLVYPAQMIRELASALDAAEQEKAAALAVIEQWRAQVSDLAKHAVTRNDSFNTGYALAVGDALQVLATVPADVLTKRDAEKWDEGAMHAEGIARGQSGESADVAADVIADLAPSDNPYRKEATRG